LEVIDDVKEDYSVSIDVGVPKELSTPSKEHEEDDSLEFNTEDKVPEV